jgi:hypothetical protein
MAANIGFRTLRLTCLALSVALVAPALPACVHHVHHGPVAAPAKKGGPPPWAPAHGYRHKHSQGVDLIFDAGLGVYVVVGYDQHYFHGKRFYRRGGSGWLASAQVRGPWLSVELSAVPAGLVAKPGKKLRHPGHGPPAKHGKGHGAKW